MKNQKEKTNWEKNTECTISKPTEPLVPSFTAADTRVYLNGNLVDLVTGIAVHENSTLSMEDFCKTIPELHNCPLESVKNAQAIIVFETLVSKAHDIPEHSEMEIVLGNEYGSIIGKRIRDVALIKKSFRAFTPKNATPMNPELVEQYILVAGKVEPFAKIIVEAEQESTHEL